MGTDARQDSTGTVTYAAYSGRVAWNEANGSPQFRLSILVPPSAPAMKVTIPWITNHWAGFIPGLPKLYLTNNDEILEDGNGLPSWHPDYRAAGVSVDGDMTELVPSQLTVTPGTPPAGYAGPPLEPYEYGVITAEYELTSEMVAPFAGLGGTDPYHGGMLLRTNVHKAAMTFPGYAPLDWVYAPTAHGYSDYGPIMGNLGVTVGSTTGPILVEPVALALEVPPWIRYSPGPTRLGFMPRR